MFQTDQAWEYRNRGSVLAEIFMHPNLRHYRCFELPWNVNLFHIDVTWNDAHSEASYWSRFVFDQISDVLIVLEQHDKANLRLSFQPRRCDGKDYVISTVLEVIEAKDCRGQNAYVYRCKNNERYIDSYIARCESELFNAHTIWLCEE